MDEIQIGSSKVNKQHLEELASAFNRGRLTLFLGAGLSFPYYIPSWQELVVGLLLSEEGSRFNRFYPHYRNALASWLAENFDFTPTTLARAVKAKHRPGVRLRDSHIFCHCPPLLDGAERVQAA